MAFNLLSLLLGGPQAASAAGNSMLPGTQGAPAMPEPVMGDDIVAQAPITHKGMFGIKGTARDILGVLGDAFLTQSGNKQIYRPQREQERQADALASFTDNPLEAVQRLNNAGFPEQAQELYKNYVTQDIARTQAGYKGEDAQAKRWGRAASLLGSATEKNWSKLYPLYKKYLAANGISAPVELSETYDPDLIQAARYSAYGADKQIDDEENRRYHDERLKDYDRGLDIQSGRAETARGKAKADVILGGGRLVEQARHNTVTEGQGQQKVNQGSQRVGQAQERLNRGASPSQNPRKEGDRYRLNGVIWYSPDGKTWKKEK